MAHYTGYLLGKVQLDGAIRSEVLANLVETLIQKYQVSDSSKKQFKFNEHHKYTVECSERGLKLTAPGCRSKDEGFESDCESIRSIRPLEAVELDLSDLINHLDIGGGKDEKETDSGTALHSSPSSPGGSMDNSSLNSSGLHGSDDNNSSSGNGSDSDEFGGGGDSTSRPPFWETLPNLSSFQSYPIEDVVFCHCDTFHPYTLVWVVRHLEKMIALVTSFRSRSEAEELFHMYRELRVKLKPVKYKINPILGLKIGNIPPAPHSPAPSPPSSSDESSSSGENGAFASLPSVFPTAILQEMHQSTSNIFSYEPKTMGFEFDGNNIFRGSEAASNSLSSLLMREPLSRTGSNSLSLHNHVYVSNPNIIRFGPLDGPGLLEGIGDESNSSCEDNVGDLQEFSGGHPQRPQRKVFNGTPVITTGKSSSSSSSSSGTIKSQSKPVLLVPLKTETVSAPKSTYPKESYLYHVMGRSSSTFAPYQRTLNFLPHQQYPNSGGEYMAWGNGGHLLVPFSSWLEQSDVTKGPLGNPSASLGRSKASGSKGRMTGRSRISANLGAKGTTSKILLRDVGRDSMWASLSQRFKKNVRENLIPKLNGMWPQAGEAGRKKRTNKKVTFNAWAEVQMV